LLCEEFGLFPPDEFCQLSLPSVADETDIMFFFVPLPVIIPPLFCTYLGPLAGCVIVGSRLHMLGLDVFVLGCVGMLC
jgi:hypothetical protein